MVVPLIEIPIGSVFGRLTVVGISEKGLFPQRLWRCVCDCGNESYNAGHKLRNGMAKSCGCRRTPGTHGWTSRKAYWSLDRINPYGNYEPENCRWATPTQQSLNHRARVS